MVWFKGIYPVISSWIEKIPKRAGTVLTWVIVLFMCCNITVSCLALIRGDERSRGILAQEGWQAVMDERFDDERLARIYPNAVKVD